MAVQVMLPGDRRQHPATPVQNATNTAKNATMNSAIIDRPISVTFEYEETLLFTSSNKLFMKLI
jgi:pheromone shutdown protein TraB